MAVLVAHVPSLNSRRHQIATRQLLRITHLDLADGALLSVAWLSPNLLQASLIALHVSRQLW